jgi:hypothetical protein
MIGTLAAASCTSSTPALPPAPTTTVTATVTSTATASAAAAPSPSPAAQIFTTPTAAAKHLYTAWQAGNRTAAAAGASKTAIDALFAHHWASGTYFFGGCSTTTECDYNFASGVIKMTVGGDATSGYTITDIAFGSAG